MNKNNYAIIMAGGVGSRFWPWSKTERPKQFLDVLGTGKTLMQQTFERVNRICPTENIFTITNKLYEHTIAEQIPQLPKGNIVSEPARRNTAPCIAYGAFKIIKDNPDANILVAPSDHVILKEDLFQEVVEAGFDYAIKNDALLTIGIKPHKPETGYGYIKSDGQILKEAAEKWQLSTVLEFTEKPKPETAMAFLADGSYFWNAGIFIWSVKAIMKAFQKHMPKLYGQFDEFKPAFNTEKEHAAIEQIFSVCDNISIDYGVMEKADNVYVIATDIGWSDLGSWSAVHILSHADDAGNATYGEKTLFYDTKDCLVKTTNGKVAVIEGLENYIVVEDEKAILVCRKDHEQRIKQFVTDVKDKFGGEYV